LLELAHVASVCKNGLGDAAFQHGREARSPSRLICADHRLAQTANIAKQMG
jgi:hypothetical protein